MISTILLHLHAVSAHTIPTSASPIQIDSLQPSITIMPKQDTLSDFHFTWPRIVAPAVLVGYGIAGLKIPGLKKLNTSTQDELFEHQVSGTKWDNYTQYMPAAMVYAYNLAGIPGKHNFRDRSLLFLGSQAMAAAISIPLKLIVQEPRPDGSNNLSWPSGHTTTAFASAQFLFEEYKETNIWLSLSGYPFAIFTGAYRVVNNRHWVSDVVAGAGFGIASTELTYWLYPKVSRLLHQTEKSNKLLFYPVISGHQYGLGFVKKL
ncbi:phosphatase PAP2 family protein [Sphingobacterium psychroaquaticum]|nr:phosphatase PAP2 family protein [Sphingobacterium psychroaquaticum]